MTIETAWRASLEFVCVFGQDEVRDSLKTVRDGPYVVLPSLSVGEMALRLYAALNYNLLVRVLPSSEAEAFLLAFVDVLGVTVHHGHVFFFAVAGALYAFRQPSALVARATALMAASYLVWIGSSLAYHVRPFLESETSFHLVRFSIALLAGIGIAFLGRDVLSAIRRSYSWPRDIARLPVWSFALVVIVLLPTSAPFLWRPLMVDPMYYPSTHEWDHSLVRLERFLVEHAEASDIVLTGDDTGE